MTDGAKQLVEVLRDNAEWCKRNNELGPYLTLGGCMALAADLIENLSADLERDERQYGRDAFAVLADEGAKLEADRDAWKRRAEAAERDINAMLRAHVDDLHCDQCKKGGYRCVCGYYTSDMCPDAEWRGPCAENGGEYEQDTPHAAENG